jgi:RND family efflux transporter MFP subunit
MDTRQKIMNLSNSACHASLLALGLASAALSHAAQPLGCLIEPYQVVEVGSQVIGVLDTVLVDRGSVIEKGQILATLKSDVEKAAAGVARSRAQAQADLQAALANRDYNRVRLNRAKDLVTRNFISPQALDQTQTEADVAEQRLAQAREQKRIWDYEHEMARAQLSLRNLVSPLSGVVIERYLSPGERVEDRPVLKIATMDPLRVEVFMPAANYRQIKPGMSATVYPELPDAGERTAKVTLVDQFIDPASNTFRVRLELANPNNELPSGLRCKVAIGDQMIGSASGPTRAPITSAPGAAAAPMTPRPPVLLPAPTTAPAPSATPAPTAAPAPPAVPKPAATLDSPPPASPALKVAAATSAASVDLAVAVLSAVERWQQAWVAKDLVGFLAAYVPDFQGKSRSRADWVRQREALLTQPGILNIQISDSSVHPLPDSRVRVDFRQRIQSPTYRDDKLRSLLLVFHKGQWLIQEDRELPRPDLVAALN